MRPAASAGRKGKVVRTLKAGVKTTTESAYYREAGHSLPSGSIMWFGSVGVVESLLHSCRGVVMNED
jgi:hypothetical protein